MGVTRGGKLVGSAATAVAPETGAMRSVSKSGEPLPGVRFGGRITLTAGGDPRLLDRCAAVLEEGGGMFGSSPFTGTSQQTAGI